MEDEFLLFLNENLGVIHRICRIYFPDRPEEREDLYQEILYQAWKSYPGFRGDAKFSTWLYKIGLNTAIVHFRKIKRRPDRSDVTDRLLEIPDSSGSANGSDHAETLMQAVKTLSPVDKAIVSLYLEDYSYEEIAQTMGISRSNVSVRLVRIKNQIAQKIKNEL
jgi:RNA polymerase sigma factor (sigma-70 family)